MATIRTRVDDVLYHLKDKKVEANSTQRVSVPGVAFGKTKARGFDVDVSDEGKKTLDRLVDQAKKDTEKAWADVLKACGTNVAEIQQREEKSASKSASGDPSASSDSAASDDDAEADDQEEDQGDDASASSAPYGSPSTS